VFGSLDGVYDPNTGQRKITESTLDPLAYFSIDSGNESSDMSMAGPCDSVSVSSMSPAFLAGCVCSRAEAQATGDNSISIISHTLHHETKT
jgi:hypothetical protein